VGTPTWACPPITAICADESVAIGSEAFYVGALGSKRTHAKRLDRLREQGATEAALARIRGPAGLPIGAVSPAEIAVSVLAQVTEALRRPLEPDDGRLAGSGPAPLGPPAGRGDGVAPTELP